MDDLDLTHPQSGDSVSEPPPVMDTAGIDIQSSVPPSGTLDDLDDTQPQLGDLAREILAFELPVMDAAGIDIQSPVLYNTPNQQSYSGFPGYGPANSQDFTPNNNMNEFDVVLQDLDLETLTNSNGQPSLDELELTNFESLPRVFNGRFLAW